MAKYRERAADVDARQVTDATFDAPHPNPEHIQGVIYDPIRRCVRVEGNKDAKIGDWLVRNDAGKVVVMTDSSFNAIFAPVEPPASASPVMTAFDEARARIAEIVAVGGDGRVGCFVVVTDDNTMQRESWAYGNVATFANAFRELYIGLARYLEAEGPDTCHGCAKVSAALQRAFEAFATETEKTEHGHSGHVH